MSMTSSLLLRPDLSSKIHPEQPEQEQDFTFLSIDHFDRLPDSLLLLVFNKIGDVKALGRCCVVSCRFHCLVPQLDNVVVRVDCVISDDDSSSSAINSSSISSSSDKSRNPFSNLFRFVFGGFVKPIQVISQFLSPKRPSGSSNGSSTLLLSKDGEVERGGVTHHSPTQVLKNFNEIRFLKKKNLDRKKNGGEEREKKNKEKGKKRKIIIIIIIIRIMTWLT